MSVAMISTRQTGGVPYISPLRDDRDLQTLSLSFLFAVFILPVLVCAFTGCAETPGRLRPSGYNTSFNFPEGKPFEEYIQATREMIARTRWDLNEENRESILFVNAPFELRPDDRVAPRGSSGKYRRGIVLIHGLSDSPYVIRPLARHLQRRGFLVRAVLLPGHGTVPGDLLEVDRRDWLAALRYGTATVKADVEEVYLGGFSTGGALCVYHALQDREIRGLILMAPALAIKDWRASMAGLLKYLQPWVGDPKEDRQYTEYSSFAVNAVHQLYLLTLEIEKELEADRTIDIPVFTALSEDDATVDTKRILEIMATSATSPRNTLVLFTKHPEKRPWGHLPGVIHEKGDLPSRHIVDISHIAIPIPKEDPLLGETGSYRSCLHYENDLEKQARCMTEKDLPTGEITPENLITHGVMRRLTYNPHFGRMMEHLDAFILHLR